jgi:hypothetical protein
LIEKRRNPEASLTLRVGVVAGTELPLGMREVFVEGEYTRLDSNQ